MKLTKETAGVHRPENELLLCCARTTVKPDVAIRIKHLARERIDWGHVLRLSLSQGVMPLLHRTLSDVCPDAVPEDILRELHQCFRANALRNLLLTQELLALLGHLEANRIPVVPFRGPVLAMSAYGDLSLRQFIDLDILVKQSDVLRTKELLSHHGYRSRFRLTRRQEAAQFQSKHHLSLIRDDERVVVEIHWRLEAGRFFFSRGAERLWRRLASLSLMGRQVLDFSPEDSLLICCSHGAKHVWKRLEWICDVAEHIRVHREMDWDRVVVRARRLRAQRMLFLGLFLAHHLLGAELPKELRQKVEDDPVVDGLVPHVCRQIFRSGIPYRTATEAFRFHIMIWDDMWDRVSYCLQQARSLIRPTVQEYQVLPLPDSLYPLYYVFRPARLAGKYVQALWRAIL